MIKKNDIIYVKESIEDNDKDMLAEGFYKVFRVDVREFPLTATYFLIDPKLDDKEFRISNTTPYTFNAKVLEKYADIVTGSYDVLYNDDKETTDASKVQ